MNASLNLTWVDLLVFIAFMAIVVTVSLIAGRNERSSEDYFLAGRKLTWPLIGFSLIASNISTEHFVGMSGSAFGRVGLAIASWEWSGVIVMVIVAWWLLPRFLRAGIYTMPEFLEYRYSSGTRAIMAVFLMVAYVIVLLATVLYSGAIALNTIFDLPGVFASQFDMSPEQAEKWAMISGIWVIGVVAGVYTVYGGLKAVVWSDLLQGAALVLGGALVTVMGLRLIGDGNMVEGWQIFSEQSADRLHLVLPWDDPDLPWLGIFSGLWIGHFFYWGFNQFITQRTLGAKSLEQGQNGIFLACVLKLLIPFVIVLPGIMAAQLYGDKILDPDKAYPYMIAKVLPPPFRGVMFAALCGAVMSTYNSGINSASTIFTIDIYKRYLVPHASQKRQVVVGRVATAVFVVASCLWAPKIASFPGVFMYIQEIWGFILPGIVAAFFIGLWFPRAPALAAQGAMLMGLPIYAFCRFGQFCWLAGEGTGAAPSWIVTFNEWSLLHHWGLVLFIQIAFMLLMTLWRPLPQPVVIPDKDTIDTTVRPRIYVTGGVIIAVTLGMYLLFW